MNEWQLGIVISLAIHGALLLVLLSMPIANALPYTKTICISFAEQEGSSSSIKKESPVAVRSKTEKVQRISNPEVMEARHHQYETDVTEKQNLQDMVMTAEEPVLVAKKSARITGENSGEKQGYATSGIVNSGTAEKQRVAETSFGNVGAPAFIHREMPVYPMLARRLGKEGRVVLKLLIDRNGLLQNIEVIEPSGFGFTEAAIEALKKSTFVPAKRNGEKVASQAILAVRFNLK
ncbi:MAG TPA: energy transducer TonB [Syntrophales bacterium]|nr:energy transducer TonB [Syntrophales bacterium]